jgi:hypothetical protein
MYRLGKDVKSPGLVFGITRVTLVENQEALLGEKTLHVTFTAIGLLKSGQVTEICLDHDLGDDELGIGYCIVLWIKKQVVLHGFVTPKLSVHSANVSVHAAIGQVPDL